MATPKEKYYEKRGQILVKNLQSRHFDAYYCATKEEALAKALELIPEGATIGWGGCMTAGQMGLMDALHQGNYKLLDRDQCKTMEEREAMQRQAFSADFFLSGANGLSLDGQMVNIDGTGNRVAPVIYGPSNVLIVAGMNKVSTNLDAAMERVRNIAAPPNCIRLGLDTPCAKFGRCVDCLDANCICCNTVITRMSKIRGRIKVILVGETLGY